MLDSTALAFARDDASERVTLDASAAKSLHRHDGSPALCGCRQRVARGEEWADVLDARHRRSVVDVMRPPLWLTQRIVRRVMAREHKRLAFGVRGRHGVAGTRDAGLLIVPGASVFPIVTCDAAPVAPKRRPRAKAAAPKPRATLLSESGFDVATLDALASLGRLNAAQPARA